ncbi:MAG: DNA adenine methylase [Patescibacteria group bacterium]|nr:DNA adenine methylase [Patescibacteria group bacterium]
MNYIGSKLSLLEFLNESIHKIADKNCKVFCDLFSGTGVVGAYFKQKGYQIIANDIQYYSYVLTQHYVGNSRDLQFSGLRQKLPNTIGRIIENRTDLVIDYLNGIAGVKGFIFKNYCLGGTQNKKHPRQYFSDENGMKCDAIRIKIEDWYDKEKITQNEYYFLLTSLLESIDKYANTASVYGAFLKHLKKSAKKRMVLKPAKVFIDGSNHKVYNEDINSLIRKIKGDILYLDPPYNRRQYAPNYHILETISKYDNPDIKGKTGLRDYEHQKSLYCQKSNANEAFRDLILNADMKYIFLSYNNEGIMSGNEIKSIMEKRGKYGVFKQDYKRYKADSSRNNIADKTTEYLHYVIVG